jgi:ABC-type nitrate/sulfonate/bicarbonate transport system substrate-binding protein
MIKATRFGRPTGLITVGVLGCAMVACGGAAATTGSPSQAASSPPAPVTIRLGWQPAAETAFLYDRANGIFPKYGINLDALEFTSGPAELAAIASNSLDIAQLGAPPWISSLAEGSGLKIIMGLENNTLDGLYVNPNSGITSINDLVGKTIGDQVGSGPDGDLHQILQKLGIPFSEVKIDNLTPPEMRAAYLHGDVSAVWTGAPYGNELVAEGAKYLPATAPSNYGFYQANFYAVSPTFLQAHPAAVADFVAAINVGCIASNANPNSVAPEFAQLSGLDLSTTLAIMKAQPNDTIAQFLSPNFPLSFVSSSGFGSQLQGLADILGTEGVVKSVPSNVASYVDATIMQQAAKVKPAGPSS